MKYRHTFGGADNEIFPDDYTGNRPTMPAVLSKTADTTRPEVLPGWTGPTTTQTTGTVSQTPNDLNIIDAQGLSRPNFLDFTNTNNLFVAGGIVGLSLLLVMATKE